MIKTIFILIIFYFVFIIENNNAYLQSDKVKERQYQERGGAIPTATTAEGVVNMTDEMKYFCIKIDASGSSIDQIEDKEHQAQCKKFLDRVSIYEMRELIDKYLEVEDN
jgi:hypothetical protein